MKSHHEKGRKYFEKQYSKGIAISEICDHLREYYRKHNDWFHSSIVSWWMK